MQLQVKHLVLRRQSYIGQTSFREQLHPPPLTFSIFAMTSRAQAL